MGTPRFYASSLIALTLVARAAAQTPPTTPATSPAASPVNVTLVTLHRQNAPVQEIVADLARPAGMKTRALGNTLGNATVDADARPFWEVLIGVCRQSKLSFSVQQEGPAGQPPSLLMTNQSLGRVVVNGPVVAQFRSIRHWSRLTEAADRRDHCEIEVDLGWEPRGGVLFYEQLNVPDEATDEAGRSLLPAPSTADTQRGVRSAYGRYQCARDGFDASRGRVTVALHAGPDAGRTIARLRGALRVFVGGATETLEIKDFVRAAKAKTAFPFIDKTLLAFDQANVEGSNLNLEFKVSENPGEADDAWDRRTATLAACTVRVVAADGQAWDNAESRVDVSSYGPDSVYLIANARRRDGLSTTPSTVVLTAPGSVTELKIPYDFRDLPLP